MSTIKEIQLSEEEKQRLKDFKKELGLGSTSILFPKTATFERRLLGTADVAVRRANERLIKAVWENDITGIEAALASGAKPDRKVLGYETTPLHLVQSAEAVDILLRASPDLSVRGGYDETVLHACRGDAVILERVLNASTDFYQRTHNRSVDVNAREKYGQTVLHMRNTSADSMKVLVEYGADVNLTDNDFKTALMRHIEYDRENLSLGNEECVAFLAGQNYSRLRDTNSELYQAQETALRDWVAEKPQERAAVWEAYEKAQGGNSNPSSRLSETGQRITTEVPQPQMPQQLENKDR